MANTFIDKVMQMKMEDGTIKYICNKCQTFRLREEFAPDENFRVPICSDCYAEDYKDDLVDILEALAEYESFGISYEKIKDYMPEKEYNQLMKLIEYRDQRNNYNMESLRSSQGSSC
jgi:ribosomal protein L40E